MRVGQAIILVIVLASLGTVSNIKTASAQGMITIRSDGLVDPPTAPLFREGDVYTFTGNISSPITIERSNIVVDGAGYTVEGNGSENGFSLYNMVNVTIKKANIKGFDSGIYLESSTGILISKNNMTENRFYGVWLYYSSNNTIVGNNLTHGGYGIWLYYSSNNRISGNAATDNSNGIGLYSFSNSNEVTMNEMSNNKMYGAYIRGSLWNVISKNVFAGNSWGLYLRVDTNNNTLSENTIAANTNYGIRLETSSNHNSILRNEITKNHDCNIYLDSSSQNTIEGNNITNSAVGLRLDSSNNYVYHNNFVFNNVHLSASGPNILDNGYPSGGNYWSGFKTTDLFSGPFQNITGADGISDIPYAIKSITDNSSNVDYYPLVFPTNSPPTSPLAEFSILSPTIPLRAGDPISFNASSSLPGWSGTHVLPIGEYRWNFGDNSTASTNNPITLHVYSFAGAYNVSLIVIDDEGHQASYAQTAEVMMPTTLSVSTSASSTLAGFAVDVNGSLRDIHGNGVQGQIVVFYYTFPGAGGQIPIASYTTDAAGKYYIQWAPSATSDFTIIVECIGNSTHLGAVKTISLSTISHQNQYVFSVESSSTVSALAFNTMSSQLSFNISGEDGTEGYARVTVAIALVPEISDLQVHLDGLEQGYSVVSNSDSWIITFSYTHSIHHVTVDLNPSGAGNQNGLLTWILGLAVAIIVVVLGILAVGRRRRKTKQPNSSKVNHIRMFA